MGRILSLFMIMNVLLFFAFSAPIISAASPSSNSQITVKLSAHLGNQSSVSISVSNKYFIESDLFPLNGSYKIQVENGGLVLMKDGKKVKNYGKSMVISPESYNTEHIMAINGRNYLGTMRFEVENGKYVRPYNTLPVEDYLKGVVSIEMSPSWGNSGGMEALKAQAIAARTYALGVSPIDDGQTDQVYIGYNWYANTNKAIEETQGIVLKYNGQVIGANALYSSSNGGKTLSKVNSWGDASWNRVPYLQVKEDPYDVKSGSLGNKNVDWQFSITKQQINLGELNLAEPLLWWNTVNEADGPIMNNIKSWLQKNGYVDQKYEVKIISIPVLSFDTNVSANQPINGSMTLNYMLRDTATNTVVMENQAVKVFSKSINSIAYTFRNMIHSSYMKSPYIKNVDDDGVKFTVHGGGWGHGIGMSQFGAYQMSKEGKSYKDILAFYYPGTTIEDVLGPTISNVSATVDENKMVTFQYELDEYAETTVSLMNPEKTVLPKTSQGKGTVQFSWDGNSLAPGQYEFNIISLDKNGNRSSATGKFVVPGEEQNSDGTSPIKLVLTAAKTYLYDGPNKGNTGQYLAPQTIYATSRQGDWYLVQTWIGPKWIQVAASSPGDEKDESKPPTNSTLTLLEKTNLYSSPSTSKPVQASIAPQTVNVVEQQGDWFKIKTWIGEKWIKPSLYMISVNEKLTISLRTNLYNSPDASSSPVSSIGPQTVNVIGKIPNSGWYQINTWIGPKWINAGVQKEAVNEKIVLKKRTNLYNDPDLNEKPIATLSPQTVTAVSKIGNTGWYEINTWLGKKWINIK